MDYWYQFPFTTSVTINSPIFFRPSSHLSPLETKDGEYVRLIQTIGKQVVKFREKLLSYYSKMRCKPTTNTCAQNANHLEVISGTSSKNSAQKFFSGAIKPNWYKLRWNCEMKNDAQELLATVAPVVNLVGLKSGKISWYARVF
jgi:hypothetical protein